MDYENIYIHVPFCEKKCDYCGFYSESSPSSERINNFLEKIENQLQVLDLKKPAKTLFFGGGTPSLLSPDELQRLSLMVKKHIPLSSDAEITMECNPESLCKNRLEVMKKLVNRVSIGVQAFDNGFLDTLGRASSEKNIEQALRTAKDFSFDNLSIDLIYGIPGQKSDSWLENLKIAVDSGVDHISCYSLTPEEGTELAGRIDDFVPVEDHDTADMWLKTGDFLQEHGISRYEVSNYARPGAECRHNVNIWHGQTYIGLGPAASSFDGRLRWTEPASLDEWLDGSEPESDFIEPEYRLIEIFIIGLRTVEGWNRQYWEQIPLQEIVNVEWQTMVHKAVRVKNAYPDLLEVNPKTIRLTGKGLLFWNTIAEAWLE